MQLIYPMFAMVLLTFLILVKLFQKRTQSVKDGTVNPQYFKTYQGDPEPESSQKLSRHFGNLFEAPVLFYVVCLAAMQVGITGAPLFDSSLGFCCTANAACFYSFWTKSSYFKDPSIFFELGGTAFDVGNSYISNFNIGLGFLNTDVSNKTIMHFSNRF